MESKFFIIISLTSKIIDDALLAFPHLTLFKDLLFISNNYFFRVNNITWNKEKCIKKIVSLVQVISFIDLTASFAKN